MTWNQRTSVNASMQIMLLFWVRLHFGESQGDLMYEAIVKANNGIPLYDCYEVILRSDVKRLIPLKIDGEKATITFLTRNYLSSTIRENALSNENCQILKLDFKRTCPSEIEPTYLCIVDFASKFTECGKCLFKYCEISHFVRDSTLLKVNKCSIDFKFTESCVSIADRKADYVRESMTFSAFTAQHFGAFLENKFEG